MSEKIEPVLKLLVGCLVFSVLALFASEIWFKEDSQLFQVLAGLVTGFGASLLTRVKPNRSEPSESGGSFTTSSKVVLPDVDVQ